VKVDAKYLDRVATKALGLVMAEKKANGVTRKEQVAMAHGIAVALALVSEGLVDTSMPPEETAARMVCAGLDSYAVHRDRLLRMPVSAAESSVTVVTAH